MATNEKKTGREDDKKTSGQRTNQGQGQTSGRTEKDQKKRVSQEEEGTERELDQQDDDLRETPQRGNSRSTSEDDDR